MTAYGDALREHLRVGHNMEPSPMDSLVVLTLIHESEHYQVGDADDYGHPPYDDDYGCLPYE